jgi:hypothetical protein
MYSADRSSSSMVAEMPRFRSTGLFTFPTSFSKSKFCMLRAPTCSGTLDLLFALDAARPGHDGHPLSADIDLAGPHDCALRAKGPARKLVRGHDAVAFLDALHHFELSGIELVDRANAAEHSVHGPCRPVNREAHRDKAVNYRIDLSFSRAFLHYD